MATKKKAGSKKVVSKEGKTERDKNRSAAEFKWRFKAQGEAGHSPIIITDGGSMDGFALGAVGTAASIEFAEGEYDNEGNGHHTSSGLFLSEVVANRPHPTTPVNQAGDPPGSAICHRFEGFTQFRIEVIVRVGNVDKTFTIKGRRLGFGRSPTIDVDRTVFQMDHAHFRPKFPQTGSRFVNPNAKIISLKIFGASGKLVHDCPLVSAATAAFTEYTVGDPHG